MVEIALKPNVLNSQKWAATNKNRKWKKANKQKRRNWNLEIIPEEESTFENEFEREHQEGLEAFDAISVAKKHENKPAGFFRSARLLGTSEYESLVDVEIKPNVLNSQEWAIIPEEECTFKKEFEREHHEGLEAFDAISVAKNPEKNPQFANCFTRILSMQPSTSYAAESMTP